MKSCGKEEHKCKPNRNGDRYCDGPAEFEKEHDKANKKGGEAENENNRKRSKYERDIRFLEAERVHVAEAEGFVSIAQSVHVSSYHWRETIPMSAAVRLSTRLRNQKIFTQMLMVGSILGSPPVTQFLPVDWAAICLKS